MTPYLNILGKSIPYYGILFAGGLVIGGLSALFRAKKRNIDRFDILCASVFAGIMGIIGAKLLSILTTMNYIIEYKIPFIEIIKNGFVFYGGLLGGTLGLLLYCKIFKLPFIDFADVFAVSVPLGHAVGRVGCFISGCCYGITYSGFPSVVYTNTVDVNTPLETPLLAIQLIESAALLVLYLVLCLLFYKSPKKGLCTTVYVISYAVIRFVLEFFRGDIERGVFLGFSTSQLISVCILIAMAYILLYRYLKKINS